MKKSSDRRDRQDNSQSLNQTREVGGSINNFIRTCESILFSSCLKLPELINSKIHFFSHFNISEVRIGHIFNGMHLFLNQQRFHSLC